MSKKNYITMLVAVIALTGFFCSRRPISASGTSPDYKNMVAQMHQRPLSKEAKLQFIQMGMPALNYMLDDFENSDFVKKTRKSLKRGFDLGKAFDKSVFATNVIDVTEGYGTIGVDALIKRLPREFVDFFKINTREFRDLGVGTVKPLLTMNMLQNPTNEDKVKQEQWITTFADKRQIIGDHEAFNRVDGLANGFWAGVVAGVVGNAVWEGLKWLCGHLPEGPDEWDGLTSFQRKTIPENIKKNQLSPEIRREVMLRRLDPNRTEVRPTN